jgi:hypothetical protein
MKGGTRMNYRKKLTAFNAEQSDIDNETDFYYVSDVDGVLDNIEQDLHSVIDKLDKISGLSEIDEIKEDLQELSEKLY